MSLPIDLNNHPIVFFDHHITSDCPSGEASRRLIEQLKADGMCVLECEQANDALEELVYHPEVCGVIFDWDSLKGSRSDHSLAQFLQKAKKLNDELPIFVLTQEHEIEDSSYPSLKNLSGYFWKYADTKSFVSGRIKEACQAYLAALYPPFFKELVTYTHECKYAWHTPGHMGGIAFLKSPIGRLFYEFYGENVFRSDLSISVPELGSLMEHSGVNGDAERYAAEVFGSDHSFFVTNGTSTANKMVMMSTVSAGDVAIIDRNCHKSLQHALTLANVIPIYFKPCRNAYGIIGGIALEEMSPESIRAKIEACPLIQDKTVTPTLAVITNSTYDGLIYNVNSVKDTLANSNIPHLHFDEAWYPYAHFNPIYSGKYAMSSYHHDYHPTVFSTQSTHKLLAAFSQASMIHVRQGANPIDLNLFNETYMMHTSTSPQYNMIASLDVSSRMMSGQFGFRLISEAITEAIAFRQEFAKLHEAHKKSSWFFNIWQPPEVNKISVAHEHGFITLSEKDAATWALEPKAKWHGLPDVTKEHLYLDPIKVTLLTPGIDMSGHCDAFGIPAPIVSRFLIDSGVVDEKTGFYSMLFLFSIGVNKSKAMTLLTDLVRFKDLFDADCPLNEIFPELVAQFPHRYQNTSVKTLAHEMHQFLVDHQVTTLAMDAYEKLPEQVLTPNQAYQHIIQQNVQLIPLSELHGKVILTMVAPYPPGIPILMPGERIDANSHLIVEYLQLLQDFDNAFPGFENEVHGAVMQEQDGKRVYAFYCLPE